MGLSIDEIREILKNPKHNKLIKKAVRHENRLRFHVESFLEASDISQPVTDFLEWAKCLLLKDKYNLFVSLFKFPTPVIQLTNSIFNDLKRIFDGKNPSENFQFTDTKFLDDWEWYMEEKLKRSEIWKKKAWNTMKTAINSIIIVDLPEDPTPGLPEPYIYFLGIENVIDFEYKNDIFEWIVFNQGKNETGKRIACFDDQYYRVLQLNEKGEITEVVIENAHNLNLCPASFFWSTELVQKYSELKKSPISPQLSNLDWLLFFSVSKRVLDLYAAYPVYSSYEVDCDFRNTENGDYCDGGFLRNEHNNYKVLRDGIVERCPVCSSKRFLGPGSFLEVPVPNINEPDLKNPVNITTIDGESLNYNVDEVKRLQDEITFSVVGVGDTIQTKQSLNERQVNANFESKVSVLNNLKRNFEEAIKWADNICCKLRYGESFLGNSVSLGTEFYVYSVDDLYDQYKQAKESGASNAVLDQIQDQIIETEYRNDSQKMQRMLILKHLEPYRHYTFNELMDLQHKELLNPELLEIKINFSTFVNRFERENTNIIEFAVQLEFNSKIDIITDKFKEYVRENSAWRQQTASTGSQTGPISGQTGPANPTN